MMRILKLFCKMRVVGLGMETNYLSFIYNFTTLIDYYDMIML
jgi:hypothetical protein